MKEAAKHEVIEKIHLWQELIKCPIIAIDGRCASGKSTLAGAIKSELFCNVIHMDDFYLKADRQAGATHVKFGGNIDYQRFIHEVIGPLSKGEDFSYRKFSCRLQEYSGAEEIKRNTLTIVEGAYACHRIFEKYYDYSIFLDIGSNEQIKRLIKRNGEEETKRFISKWIPFEEEYFNHFGIKDKSDLYVREEEENEKLKT